VGVSSCVAFPVSGGFDISSDKAGQALSFGLGFALSATGFPATDTKSQPRFDDLSLDLDFFVQVADHQYKVPIMPL
jgi:hypothetical protein